MNLNGCHKQQDSAMYLQLHGTCVDSKTQSSVFSLSIATLLTLQEHPEE